MNTESHLMEVDIFKFHKLNKEGQVKAVNIQMVFEKCLEGLKENCAIDTREFSIVKTKLEEACFFAKKSMAIQTENQMEI